MIVHIPTSSVWEAQFQYIFSETWYVQFLFFSYVRRCVIVSYCGFDFLSLITSLIAQLVKNPPAMQETLVLIPGSGRSTGKRIGYPLLYSWASLVAQLVRIHLQCGRPRFNPWVGKIPGEGKGYPLQYSGLENSTDSIVHGVAKSWTLLRDLHFHFQPHL